MSRKRTELGQVALVAAFVCTGLTVSGCEDEGASEDCVDNLTYFKEQVWVPIMSQNCIQCHTASGAASHTDLRLVTSDWGPDWAERNLQVVEELAKRTYEGESWLLLKPTNQIPHEGLERFAVGSDEYKAFEGLIERIADPVVCADDGSSGQDAFFDGVIFLDEVATLRKATLSLAGRLPSLEEEQRVRDGGFDALDLVLDEVMVEEAFFSRVKEIYNDRFLTDRYISENNGTPAIDLLDVEEDYPNAYWFDELPDGDYDTALRFSNDAVAREALELVAHLVREDRPFTEVLTAPYTMVNPWSAQVYGVNPTFNDPTDPKEFVEAKLPGIPHAGVLSSHMMMNRLPTTATNRNRHRARMTYELFLATDVQRLGNRPIDPTNIQDFNPTMNNPNCTLCHAIIDPVAGTFQNWDELGRYRVPETWFTDMRPPGFGEAILPAGEFTLGLPWLAEQVVADPRFAVSATHILFEGLSGQEPLREPTDTAAADYLAKIRAFEMQSTIFGDMSTKFAESGHNLKALVKEIVKSPYYRAADAEDLDEVRELELAEVGTGRLLTPESLHRKVEAVTGYPWRRDVDDSDYLLDLNWYRIFYGGIDSDSVIERISEPNGIMANVAARMSHEVSCWASARDFVLPPSERRLFPFVEQAFEPEDANGFEVPAAATAIRTNIQYLHERMLGEFLELNDPEINRTYELYLAVWKDGKSGLAEGTYEVNLPFQCQARQDFWTEQPLAVDKVVDRDSQYTVRAWMAVMTYLLSDYRFLHE